MASLPVDEVGTPVYIALAVISALSRVCSEEDFGRSTGWIFWEIVRPEFLTHVE